MSSALPRHSVAVVGIAVDDAGRVLAIRRRDNGHWQPPGGVLELGETIEDGVRREVLEETGVEVEPVQLTGVYKNMLLGVVALVFRCRLVAGTPGPTAEAPLSECLRPHPGPVRPSPTLPLVAARQASAD